MRGLQRLLVVAALVVAAPAFAIPPKTPVDFRYLGSFSCEDGQIIKAMFNADAAASAVVLAPDGVQHLLAIQEPVMSEPQVRWTDGEHTLTWRAGVTLGWKDGSAPIVACLRGDGGHHH
jgi:hypothetical protein